MVEKLYYSEPKTNQKELIWFIVLEFIIVVTGYGTWNLLNNPYQQIAIIYCWVSVVITLVAHISRVIPHWSLSKWLNWGSDNYD